MLQLSARVACMLSEDGMVTTPWTTSISFHSVNHLPLRLILIAASNLWLEIRRIKGVRPKPRYRHSAVAYQGTIFIFGGVDTQQQRFNDIFSYETDNRKWQEIETLGLPPKERTFHKAVIFNNVMYVVGGFDGSRLNDIYHIALPGSLDDDELAQSV